MKGYPTKDDYERIHKAWKPLTAKQLEDMDADAAEEADRLSEPIFPQDFKQMFPELVDRDFVAEQQAIADQQYQDYLKRRAITEAQHEAEVMHWCDQQDLTTNHLKEHREMKTILLSLIAALLCLSAGYTLGQRQASLEATQTLQAQWRGEDKRLEYAYSLVDSCATDTCLEGWSELIENVEAK